LPLTPLRRRFRYAFAITLFRLFFAIRRLLPLADVYAMPPAPLPFHITYAAAIFDAAAISLFRDYALLTASRHR